MGAFLDMAIFIVPLVVALVVIGSVAKFLHGLGLALLGRAQPTEVAPATPVGRFLGLTLSRLLAPLEQIVLVASTLIVALGVFLIADRWRLWDDGLVDVTAKVVAAETRCAPRGETPKVFSALPICPQPIPPDLRPYRTVDLERTTASGETIRVTVRRDLLPDPRAGVGDTVVVAHPVDDPTGFATHLHQNVLLDPWTLILAGVVVRAAATVIRRLRRSLTGTKDEAGEGLFVGLLRMLRRRRGTDPDADEGFELPSGDRAAFLARTHLAAGPRGSAGSARPAGGFGRRASTPSG